MAPDPVGQGEEPLSRPLERSPPEIKPPTKVSRRRATSLEAHEREVMAQYIDRVMVRPGNGRGIRTWPGDRADVYYMGAAEPATPAPQRRGTGPVPEAA